MSDFTTANLLKWNTLWSQSNPSYSKGTTPDTPETPLAPASGQSDTPPEDNSDEKAQFEADQQKPQSGGTAPDSGRWQVPSDRWTPQQGGRPSDDSQAPTSKSLDSEILDWVRFAKGDVVGHPFHGNQYSQFEQHHFWQMRKHKTLASQERARGNRKAASAHESAQWAHKFAMRMAKHNDPRYPKVAEEAKELSTKAFRLSERVPAMAKSLDHLTLDTQPTFPKPEVLFHLDSPTERHKSMSDYIDNEIQEWIIPLYKSGESVIKGGPGSGEHEGHPFRGNGSTGGMPQAKAFNPRGDENRSMTYHAIGHANRVAQAMAAIHRGDFGAAMRHFNEASRHGAHVAMKAHGVDKSLHQAGKNAYATAHHAGDLAQIANKANNDLARAVRNGADAASISMLTQAAKDATNAAIGAAGAAMGVANENQGLVQRGAFDRVAQRAAGQ